MAATPLTVPIPRETSPLRRALDRLRGDPAYQGFTLLRIGFVVLPIVFGADKFANVLVNWERYLAPWIAHLSPLSKLHTMHIVGVIEIVAGIAVAIKPRYGAYLVAAWLAGIVANLFSYSGYYDIALRDFGLMLAPSHSLDSPPSSIHPASASSIATTQRHAAPGHAPPHHRYLPRGRPRRTRTNRGEVGHPSAGLA